MFSQKIFSKIGEVKAMIEKMNETGIENLTNAIVLQAVEDYRRALAGGSVNGRDSKSVIAECERFFQSVSGSMFSQT